VTNGALLVELDASNLEDEKINQQIQVENAYAAFITAQENLAVVTNKAQSDVDQAELDFEFAKLDLRKYIEGDSLRDLNEAKARITLAEQDLEQAAEELKWSKILYEEEYLAESVMRTDELAHEKTKFDLDLARENLRVLEEYTHQRTLAELKSNVKQTEMALERTTRKAAADAVQAEASLRAKESEYKRQKTKLEKLVDQIAKAKVYAPADGLVVYATSARGGWRGNDEPMAEGRMVREREELIYLPTALSYMAEVKIHESALQSIRVGHPATVKADAVPDKVFSG
jgi:HlyD family secretion protein